MVISNAAGAATGEIGFGQLPVRPTDVLSVVAADAVLDARTHLATQHLQNIHGIIVGNVCGLLEALVVTVLWFA
jgi:hypothetical protein